MAPGSSRVLAPVIRVRPSGAVARRVERAKLCPSARIASTIGANSTGTETPPSLSSRTAAKPARGRKLL
jgi:hypothetical protein